MKLNTLYNYLIFSIVFWRLNTHQISFFVFQMVPWEIWRLSKGQKNCHPIFVLRCAFNSWRWMAFSNSQRFTDALRLATHSDHHCDKAFPSVELLLLFPLNGSPDIWWTGWIGTEMLFQQWSTFINTLGNESELASWEVLCMTSDASFSAYEGFYCFHSV